IAAELLISPRSVRRVRQRPAPAAQLRHVRVFDRQRLLERLPGEMRIAARTGIASDVGEPLDVVLAQQADQLVKCLGGVSDRVDAHGGCRIYGMARVRERAVEDLEYGRIAFYLGAQL